MTKKKYCECERKLVKRKIKDGICQRCGLMVEPNVLKNLRLYKKNRQTWKIDPSTKIEKDKTKYNRNREKRKIRKRIKKAIKYFYSKS